MSKSHALVFVVALGLNAWIQAQELPSVPAPQKEHEWLQQFVGEWESEAEAMMGPGQPPTKCKGSMSTRMLGGFWMVSEVKGEAMGTQVSALQTIGYDTKAKKYVGTWVDSMINHMWKYEGTVDAAGKTLTLEAEGPDFTQAGKMSKFRDIYEFKSKDEIATSSQILGEDGKWITFMNGTAKRKR